MLSCWTERLSISEKASICLRAWRSTMRSSPVQKHTNMKYWRKHRGAAIAYAFAFCMPLAARRPPQSKKRLARKRASSSAAISRRSIIRFQRRKTGDSSPPIPPHSQLHYLTYWKRAAALEAVALSFCSAVSVLQIKRGGVLFCCGLHLLQVRLYVEIQRCARICVT